MHNSRASSSRVFFTSQCSKFRKNNVVKTIFEDLSHGNAAQLIKKKNSPVNSRVVVYNDRRLRLPNTPEVLASRGFIRNTTSNLRNGFPVYVRSAPPVSNFQKIAEHATEELRREREKYVEIHTSHNLLKSEMEQLQKKAAKIQSSLDAKTKEFEALEKKYLLLQQQLEKEPLMIKLKSQEKTILEYKTDLRNMKKAEDFRKKYAQKKQAAKESSNTTLQPFDQATSDPELKRPKLEEEDDTDSKSVSASVIEVDVREKQGGSASVQPNSILPRCDEGMVFNHCYDVNNPVPYFYNEFGGISWKVYTDDLPKLTITCNESTLSNLWRMHVAIKVSFTSVIKENGSIEYQSTEEFYFGHRTCHLHLDRWDEILDPANGFNVKDKINFSISLQWLQVVHTHPRNTSFSFKNHGASDVTVVGNTRKFYLNKMYLSWYSAYFYMVFYGENASQAVNELRFDGVDDEEFYQLLLAIYPTRKDPSDLTVEMLLKMAERFRVPIVTQICQKFLLTESRLSSMKKFDLAERFSLHNLQHQCLSQIKTMKDIYTLKTQPGYQAIGPNTKIALLDLRLPFA